MAMGWAGAVEAGMSALNTYLGSSSAGKASARQYAYNLALQQQAQAWNEKMYKHRYQWQVDDLEKAGINKLYGLGTAPSPTSGLNSVGMEDDQGNENKRKELGLQALGLTSEISARQAQTKLTENQAKTELINANLKQQEVIGAQLDNTRKQLENQTLPDKIKLELKNEEARLSNQLKDLEVKNIGMFVDVENMKTEKYNARTGRMNAQTNARNAETNARNANTNEKVGKSQAYKNYNSSGGFNTTVKAGPFLWSHTGNANGYTKNSGDSARYVTERINGKNVKVRVFK